MKIKLLAILLSLALSVTFFASCSGKSDMLKDCGEDVISMMIEMIESDEYNELYDFPDTYGEEISKLRECDYSTRPEIYELTVPVDQLMENSFDEEDFSEDLYQYVCSSALISFSTRVNQASGINAIAVSSMFSAQKSFASKKIDESTIYLYVFEDAYPIAVTFIADGEDAFRGVGYFILNDEFDTDDEDSIRKSCKDLGIGGVTVKKQ